ncbi:hypothetical protein BUALT_Bualt02G0116100 [Buddleja alternifolia]|uniref:BHLH domain-containing protein n=1 Tax=Buddleja alternifolia TaxID=168488 RepID=A0AAV6XZI2_9LAMI|nr:hypothetical protein BUALT_Bualt02G0116100 [Buddleja alternifolia]
MMAGNPNWWSMNGSMHPQSHHQFHVMGGEEDRFGASLFQQQKKLEDWEDQVLLNPLNPSSFTRINHPSHLDHVKREQINPESNYHNHHHHHHDSISNWLHQGIPVSSPTSCITSLSNNILNFSGAHKAAVASPAEGKNRRHNQDHSSECNSMSSGGVSKKARVQHSSPQPALKTDTASVLSEAIGYIRFLQGQIEDSQSREEVKELRSRGLCLVPISCTQNVGNENGADYWAPAALGGGF